MKKSYTQQCKNAKRNTTNWHFEKWLMNALHINTIKCKKFATIVLGQSNTILHQTKII